MVFWVMWRSAENIEEKKKTDKENLKSEAKEKWRKRGKSNNSSIHLWF